MATSSILTFAQGTGPNVLSDAAYSAISTRGTGAMPGVASAQLNNKALLQLSAVAAGVAQFMANLQSTNITDQLTPSQMATALQASVTGRFISRQVITSTQAITPPSGAVFGNCIVVGGGGGGGGSAVTGAGQVSAGAGGGGAGWAVKKIAAASLSGLTATVGAAGVGGVIAAGSNGGTSSIGALITGVGGGGGNLGAAGTPSNSLNGSGFAGNGTLGDYNFTGQVGQYAIYAANPLSGSGGSSFGGGGASWQIGGYVTGNSANGYGCGGSGGASVASQGGTTGGNGGPGVIIIDWYQ